MSSTLTASRDLFRTFPVRDFDLAATLDSGQAFRWQRVSSGWQGVVQCRWVGLCQKAGGIEASIVEPTTDWSWLEHYLQLGCRIGDVTASFPKDEPMRRAIEACPGLRLLRQEIWECLASFILSSTKQIVQIRQIIEKLCARIGRPVAVPTGVPPAFEFPTAADIANVSEVELRALGMGFRAPYLAATARLVASGGVNLEALPDMNLESARSILMQLPGVGRKIADCVLLFGAGHMRAFPVDVWVLRTLRELYFGARKRTMSEVVRFAESYFGPNAGYAQQYLFHAARVRAGKLATENHGD